MFHREKDRCNFFFKDEKTLQNLVVFSYLQPGGHKETFL